MLNPYTNVLIERNNTARGYTIDEQGQLVVVDNPIVLPHLMAMKDIQWDLSCLYGIKQNVETGQMELWQSDQQSLQKLAVLDKDTPSADAQFIRTTGFEPHFSQSHLYLHSGNLNETEASVGFDAAGHIVKFDSGYFPYNQRCGGLSTQRVPYDGANANNFKFINPMDGSALATYVDYYYGPAHYFAHCAHVDEKLFIVPQGYRNGKTQLILMQPEYQNMRAHSELELPSSAISLNERHTVHDRQNKRLYFEMPKQDGSGEYLIWTFGYSENNLVLLNEQVTDFALTGAVLLTTNVILSGNNYIEIGACPWLANVGAKRSFYLYR